MIDTSSWKRFRVGDLFDTNGKGKLPRGKCHSTDLLENGSDVWYIGAKRDDNGLIKQARYDADLVVPGNCVVFICNGEGSVGYCTYQNKPFIASSDLKLGYASFLTPARGLFLVTVCDLERPKYSFGRKWGSYVEDTHIKLPATDDGSPDWERIDDFIGNLRSKPITTSVMSSHIPLDVSGWSAYTLGELFDIRKGKRLTSEDQTAGATPYIGAISSNNGVAATIGQEPIHEGNTISLSYNGSVGEAFYQPMAYWATDDVNALYLRTRYGTLNVYRAMFVCAVLRMERYRFSYGRKWKLETMRSSVIWLPSVEDGSPDWDWMEAYIRSLPYSDRLEG